MNNYSIGSNPTYTPQYTRYNNNTPSSQIKYNIFLSMQSTGLCRQPSTTAVSCFCHPDIPVGFDTFGHCLGRILGGSPGSSNPQNESVHVKIALKWIKNTSKFKGKHPKSNFLENYFLRARVTDRCTLVHLLSSWLRHCSILVPILPVV